MSKKLFDYISNDGKNVLFGVPTTEELIGREALLPDGEKVCFGNEMAIKCDDDLFLADVGGRILLVEEAEDLSLKALDAEKAASGANTIPEDLEGWETDLSLASGYVLTGLFADGKLRLAPSPEPEIPEAFAGMRNPSENKEPEVLADPVTYTLETVVTGDKRFLFRFPETGEVVFFNARRFLLYALMEGRTVTGFVEIPPKE
ncbi:MAG: hypothetical protein Q4D15_01430 [Lachnospiraceae bacterium]|nr:hypothetical protein [Lachnospiraceae bacterium]MBR3360722.1 hypothetical protein [Lachnospiraceae bacterium]MBR6356893.1 hypothetical protein [Lachnospiraceae bacterium]MDO4206235.1 hypothetical protein [Lachnospiraceae bacterium]